MVNWISTDMGDCSKIPGAWKLKCVNDVTSGIEMKYQRAESEF